MTHEQNQQLEQAISAVLTSKEMKALKTLVFELSLKEECIKGDYNNIYPHVERNIDSFAELTGWIYELLYGKPKRGLSKLQKIRKALGYSYP